MSTLFSRLFSAQAPADDGFTQIQREAVVDLLNFCSYADDKLALAEDAIVARELENVTGIQPSRWNCS